ncbi:MAG: shikimate dehydrogenase [Deltaproteobacteria bacterium]|nr:shikimate dehydrogenase [Deltaproteobacteria bacterium]
MRLGLLGHPVGHSLSPAIHQAALAALGLAGRFSYGAHDIPPERLGETIALLRRGGWRGVNLTHPHKVAVLPLLDDPGPDGRRLGAVNTVVVAPGGRLVGHSTDGPGFVRSLAAWERLEGETGPSAPRPDSPGDAVLLGAGGAARAIAVALAEQGRCVHLISRRREGAEQVLAVCPAPRRGRWAPWAGARETEQLLAAADLLVGCTDLAAGSTPGDGAWRLAERAYALLPLFALRPPTKVVDIVYRPTRTPLLCAAAARGCPTLDGLGMLVEQAALACALWTGMPAPLAAMRQAARQALAVGSLERKR